MCKHAHEQVRVAVGAFMKSLMERQQTGDEEAMVERKKQEAKERQARIMAQFAKDQTAFAQKYSGLYDDVSDEDDEKEAMEVDEGMVL